MLFIEVIIRFTREALDHIHPFISKSKTVGLLKLKPDNFHYA